MTQDITATTQPSLIRKFADKYSVDASKMMATLTATAFRQRNDQPITNEQMMALLIVADQYHLNPFTKEIYAFPDKGGIVPIVGVDGWSRIINEHGAFDGMHFTASEEDERIDDHHKRCPASITCTMYRKDRSHPIVVTEYLDEVYREPFIKNGNPIKGPWQSHTKRFLRHKAMTQCARMAFGFTGIYDQDEAERIIEGEVTRPAEAPRPVNSGYKAITEDQAVTLQALIDETGADKAALLADLGVETLGDISNNRYPLVVDRLRAEEAEDA